MLLLGWSRWRLADRVRNIRLVLVVIHHDFNHTRAQRNAGPLGNTGDHGIRVWVVGAI
jgi:hypothetical protein